MEGRKMRALRNIVTLALIVALSGVGMIVQAQQARRTNDRQVRQLLARIETRSDLFKQNLEEALTRVRYSGAGDRDDITQMVSDFENSVDRLKTNFNSRTETRRDVEDVLNRASSINSFLNRVRLETRVTQNWATLRTDLSELARLYNVSWNWTAQTYPPYGQGNGTGVGNAANRLTGTYRIDTARSEDPRAAAERATRTIPSRDRQRTLDALTARLESPETLAIDRRGRNVTIASSRAQQITFDADGRDRVEQLPNGREIRVRASLAGDQLSISQTGDRGNDYSVSFDPIDNGNRLRITRRISADRLTQPVVVESIYDKTSPVAQLDLYNGYPNYPTNTGTTTATGDFMILDGTQLVGVLNNDLTTKDTRENDRFTMTVNSPSEYNGAVIEGYVTGVNRSGRVTGRSEMTLNFDRIRMADGRTYRFSGFVEQVRTPGGEVVKVDNEGNVRESESRTSTTAKRAAIGTAVGAIIGAIAGGGKGAAIGAIVGAGAGAGSVYIQGQDDLDLPSGTEVVVRASAPR
jgi:hypothetical protein